MSPTLEGDVLSWASQLEPDVIKQAQRTASLPFVEKPLALMPDAHIGMGATIGSVIATHGAVVPSACGVDLGCLDAATEFMTPNGWKRFDEYEEGDLVLQFDPRTDSSNFTEPLAYIKKPEEWFYHLKHKKGLDQKVCPNHKMLLYKGYNRVEREYSIEISSNFFETHEQLHGGRTVGFLSTFKYQGGGKPELQEVNLIRLQIAVCADGHLLSRNAKKDRCVVHIKKQRKIDRLQELLGLCDIEYSLKAGTSDTVYIEFKPPIWNKSLEFLLDYDSETLKKVVDELFLWDGYTAEDGQRTFSTSIEEEADIVQFVMAATGTRCGVFRVDYPNKENWAPTFSVYTTKNKFVNVAPHRTHPVEKVPSEDGFSYCFTVPTGFLVVRRNGNIFTTGNCGVSSVLTNLTSGDLPDDLNPLHHLISESIPSGVGKGNRYASTEAMRWVQAPNSPELSSKQEVKAAKQLGTLGSGNHFVEICLDELDQVWVMLHSGSRGIGNELARIHIEGAKNLMEKYFIELEDKDLAYLVEGTPEFDAYISAMLWSQDYAAFNRELMMKQALQSFQIFLGAKEITPALGVNCHHNFCEMENHHGKNLWVTRKGAVRARVGDWGVIPGSMGTKSYVVKGKGNLASYNSSSHGAGRLMSRTKAKKTLDIAGLEAQMKGKAWNSKNAVNLIDEDPRAYKDIDQVMADQDDLVEVKYTLRQILNYKGQ